MRLTSAKEKWDLLTDEEQEIVIVQAPKFREQYKRENKIEFMYDFDTYLKERMFLLPLKKTRQSNIKAL